MRLLFGLCSLLLLALPTAAQQPLRVLVRDERSHQPLPGVTVAVPALKAGATTDAAGRATLPDLPAGPQQVQFSSIGYAGRTLRFNLPQAGPEPALVELEPSSLELQGVVVEATRTNSRIEDIPLRVEVIGEEDVMEESSFRPADISKMLTELAGVQAQFTSAAAASVAFRIQGLDGRYTQVLKDGFPLFGGFSQGLSLVQIPPLDLRQVEVIKGASSALYGGDAIAGLINLVSKTPTPTPELNLLLNQTHKGGRDLTAYYRGRTGRLGLTLLATQNTQQARDVDGDGFTDLPELELTNFNPRLYYYISDSTTAYAGLTATVETRTGGDLEAVRQAPTPLHSYLERNRSQRYSSQLRLDSHIGRGRLLTLKNSVSAFERGLLAGAEYFAGRQLSTYSEASLLLPAGRHRAVLGANFLTDNFSETSAAAGRAARDYRFQTYGLFGQDDWQIGPALTVQAGLRTDYQRPYGLFVLPRLSALLKAGAHVSLRAGGGLGYKAPTIFSADAEQRAYAGVEAPTARELRAETARGLNADLTLRGQLDEVSFVLNQAAFYTQLRDALLPDPALLVLGRTVLRNAPGPIRTRGLETNLRLQADELQLFAAYTFTDTRPPTELLLPGQPTELPFVARHRLVLSAVTEAEGQFRVGAEATYNGSQYLGDGLRRGRGYWVLGLLAEKPLPPHFSVVVNIENLLDVRQTRFEPVVLGPADQPTFRPLYAPLDGIVGNVALKINL